MSSLIVERGVAGPRGVVTGAWTKATEAALKAAGCRNLELNHAKGWQGEDVDFLVRLPDLQRLAIVDHRPSLRNIEGVHHLRSLRCLSVDTCCNTPLRFDNFVELESCWFEWRPGSESVFQCQTLKRLGVNKYLGKSFAPFSQLPLLQSLKILGAPITSLDGIANLPDLRRLSLGLLRQLTHLADLAGASQLEELEIRSCRRIGAIEEVANLTDLRVLIVADCGDIASLRPVGGLINLEGLLFYESTNIADGDLSPIESLPRLRVLSFQNRRHYSHRREQFAAFGGSLSPGDWRYGDD